MSVPAAAEGPARRFLHLCYCCADAEAVAAFFVEGLGMRLVMSTPVEPSDGSLLGIEGEIVSAAVFVYDARGPRVSPALEIQTWVHPSVTGVPSTDPTEAGMKALGVAVPDLAAAVARLVSLGCRVVHDGELPWAGRGATLLDPWGVTLEVVEDPTLAGGPLPSRLRHLRVTCTDLAVSLPFHERLGFRTVGEGAVERDPVAGLAPCDARFVRLRLPDEAFEVVAVEWTEPATHGRHPDQANHAGLYRAALGVDDTRAAHAELAAEGVPFDPPPRLVELHGTPVPDMWITFLRDPDGMPFEFVQRPRDAFRPG